MSLAARIDKIRAEHRRCTRMIAHARRLYIAFCWPDIKADRSNTTLNFCAKRMVAAGLYCSPPSQLRLVRYSILRQAWKWETGGRWCSTGTKCWSRWLAQHGYVVWAFERQPIKEIA